MRRGRGGLRGRGGARRGGPCAGPGARHLDPLVGAGAGLLRARGPRGRAPGPAADLLRWAVTTAARCRAAARRAEAARARGRAGRGSVATVADVRPGAGARPARGGPRWSAALAVTAVALPLLLLPDATAVVWPTVEPVELPAAVDRPARRGRARGGRRPRGAAAVAVLPALRLGHRADLLRPRAAPARRRRAGRRPPGRGRGRRDPHRAGESALARELGDARWRRCRSAGALAPTGIGWVVVWRDDPAAEELDLTGLEPVAESAGGRGLPQPAGRPGGRRDHRPGAAVTVRAVDAAVLLLVLVAWAVAAGAARRRTRW